MNQQELRAITDMLLEKRPGSVRAALEELRTCAESRLRDLRGLLGHPESVHQARALLAEHIGKITLEPTEDGVRQHYVVKGAVIFFREAEAVIPSRVGGAGGQACTELREVPALTALACRFEVQLVEVAA